eukprot:CAMPEP_0202916638 /NCGR_PEP_ID=MMETSP1392-20130828/69102_1 /ASSEMBLY_ACC=CAM_ASM_000868 /TAXON_ID=225041 /ORGANISM="Chlamydomonas chlamydogama, Strain SAG 11-48b" /LENGTH=153 /DNA_ID=CAMNT_0049609145 /DNA_START=29 /DNA_END=486 /DNA_ORIENTATION=-
MASGWSTANRLVVTDGCHMVDQALQAGLLPVLHGDCVLDSTLGCTILSGDTIMSSLAAAFRPEYAVFLTNVAGVYDRPPQEAGAKLLRSIAVHPDGSWEVEGLQGGLSLTSAAHDVTGGIAKKVQEAAAIARLGMPVVIAEAGTTHGAQACMG